MINKTLILAFFSISSVTQLSSASELFLNREQALKQGFKPHGILERSFSVSEVSPHSMPWPVKFIDTKHTIGNSAPEYQNYGPEAYYHGGADLRVSKQAPVVAPVSGFLMGNYYSYVTDPLTGEDKKYTKPLSEGGDDLYFEITIQLENGAHLELHHVNPENLPQKIRTMILARGGAITAGETVGYTSLWPVSRFNERYDHIHYNMISASGVSMNPEYFSLELEDSKAPVIRNIFAIYKNKKTEVLQGRLEELPLEIVVSAADQKGENIYPLPPSRVEMSWGLNEKTGWDFTQYLMTTDGRFPDIRDVYARQLRLNDGRTFTTRGDYSYTDFLFRLKVPTSATSPLLVTVTDVSGNKTELKLEIR